MDENSLNSFQLGLETILLSNILIEMFIFTGQSNIEFKFKDCDRSKQADRYLRWYYISSNKLNMRMKISNNAH